MSAADSSNYLVLFLGADWWGSDARALATALRRQGQTLIEVNSEDFCPPQWSTLGLRVLRRLCRPWLVDNYNRVTLQHADNPAIEFVLVFKGKMLLASTLRAFRERKIPLYCFYPDVSFLDHGREIWSCLPLYDCVFTTKSFHLDDPALRSRVRAMRLVRHGFDPEVHRRLALSPKMQAHYACDVSFVGCWTPKKERLLAAVARSGSGRDLRIWGPEWGRSAAGLRRFWQQRGAYGDELSLIYGATKINLGLLSEPGGGTESGDLVTARTWQIPAAGGFLLHEDSVELRRFFTPRKEVAVFHSEADLQEQIHFYLGNSELRLAVQEAGYKRSLESRFTLDAAADDIMRLHAQRSAQL